MALQGEELSSQPVPAEHGAGEMALVIKVDAALGSVGKEENQWDFYVTIGTCCPPCLTAACGEGESVGIGRGPDVWRSFLVRSSRVSEDSPAEP